MFVCSLIFTCFLMMGMAEGKCKAYRSGGWYCYDAAGITASVPNNLTSIEMKLNMKKLDFLSMTRLTNLESIVVQDSGSQVIKSSDFAIFPNLKELEIKAGNPEKIEMAGIIVFLHVGLVLHFCFCLYEK